MSVNGHCKKEAKKISKDKELEKEIRRIQNVKTKVIPVIIRTTSIISISFTQYLIYIYVNEDTKQLQKTSILGAVHIFRNVLL
jgi:hypothetical protein